MDTRLYDWINGLADRTAWAHPVMVAVAKDGVVLFGALLVVAFLDARHRRDARGVAAAVWAGGAAVLALAIGQVIGNIVDRARPYSVLPAAHVLIDRSHDFSFPSDHATAVGAVAAGLLLAGRRRWGIVAAVAAVVMAFARVYVGVHFPGDVLAGLALGAGVAVVGGLVAVPLLARLVTALAGTRARRLVVGGSDEPRSVDRQGASTTVGA